MKTNEASRWLMRLQGDNVPQSEVAAWLDWCNADPRNLEAFDQAQGLYDQLLASNESVRADFLRLADEPGSAPLVRSRRFRQRWAYAGTGMAATVALALIWNFWSTPSVAVEQEQYDAAHGEQRKLTLVDESRVVLADSSTLTSRYTAERRLTKLGAGEAYFEVHKDPNRPFVVDAGELTVTAIGTAFNVRRTRERIVVSVTEGAVDVASAAGEARTPVRLREGQEAVYAPNARGLVVSPVNPATVTARQAGRFEYLTEPLGSVLDEVNRYSPNPIVATDERVRRLVFTGTIFRQQAREWALALDTVFPVQVSQREDGSIVLEPR